MPRIEREKIYRDYVPFLVDQFQQETFLQKRMKEDFIREKDERSKIEQIVKKIKTIKEQTAEKIQEPKEQKTVRKEETVEKTRNQEMVVVATAYYGVLPNQSSYTTGSYKGDIKLNGTGITKSGKPVKVGHIAAEWSILPEGTRVYVPGYGDAVVEDIGPAIKGKRIDLFMGYGEEGLEKAIKWGKRSVKIEIKE
jgi:3D (Asp-Asp-Asp) domain-containing protein